MGEAATAANETRDRILSVTTRGRVSELSELCQAAPIVSEEARGDQLSVNPISQGCRAACVIKSSRSSVSSRRTLVPYSDGRGALTHFTKHRQIGIRVSPVLKKLPVRLCGSALIAGSSPSASEAQQRGAAVRRQLQPLFVDRRGLACAPGLQACLTQDLVHAKR